jgi:HK97 family phage major capsid protein
MDFTLEELSQKILDAVIPQLTVTTEKQYDALKKEVEEKLQAKFSEEVKALENKFRAEEEEKKKATGEFKSLGENFQAIMKASMPGGLVDARLKAPSGLNEGVGSEGAFLLQDQYASELITKTHETGILAKKCKKLQIGPNYNSITLNAVVDETSRANGSRWGGIQVFWDDEADQVAATKPKWRKAELKLKKLTGAYYATEELLQDATALGQIMTMAFTEEFGFKVDDSIFAGNGAGQPLGITNGGAFISITKEANQAADTIVAENIAKMWMRMYARSRSTAEWYINQDCEMQLWKMFFATGVGGVPLFMPPGGFQGSPPGGSLLGRPINTIEHSPTLGDANDITFMDLSQYLLVEKGGIVAAESIHVRFLYGENTFRFIYRVDGQPLWSAPLTPYKGTANTLSPFIGLGERA